MTGRSEFDEAAYVGNSPLGKIEVSPFHNGAGKYFSVVLEENDSTAVEYSTPIPIRNRIKLRVTFLNGANDISNVTFKKFKQYSTKGVLRWVEVQPTVDDPLSFTHFSFEKLLAFLHLLSSRELVSLEKQRLAVADADDVELDPNVKAAVRNLLRHPDGADVVRQLLCDGEITSRDLVNIGYRKQQLSIFTRLLTDPDYVETYKGEHGIKGTQQEAAWQEFFRRNSWIFGFGLDYRYLGILQQEAHLSQTTLDGRGGVIGDYLVGAKDFTVLVELKRPDTELFKKNRNRAQSWKLSDHLIDAFTQILEQKASWLVKGASNASGNFTDKGVKITQQTVDPKCILIVGRESEFSGSDEEAAIKRRTFELFRRDSRNIEILTFDELYTRASFILAHSERNL